jgi:hypothetical protein
MFKKISTYICWKIHKMGCLEGSGVPVLYRGRTVPKRSYEGPSFTPRLNSRQNLVMHISISIFLSRKPNHNSWTTWQPALSEFSLLSINTYAMFPRLCLSDGLFALCHFLGSRSSYQLLAAAVTVTGSARVIASTFSAWVGLWTRSKAGLGHMQPSFIWIISITNTIQQIYRTQYSRSTELNISDLQNTIQ